MRLFLAFGLEEASPLGRAKRLNTSSWSLS
jgi:hypothetical protein